MFIEALFTIAKTWKQSKCPLTDEWIKKMWYTYTVECYQAIKRNEIIPFATTWMDLEIIILSEVSQRKANIIQYHLSVQFSHSVVSNSLQPHGLQHTRLPVHHQLQELAQTHVHQVSDAIQPSYPLSPLLLLPPIFPSIRVFSNESVLHFRWPKYYHLYVESKI